MTHATTIDGNTSDIQHMLPIPPREIKMVNVQEIRTSELRYRRLFEAAQDGILILDAQTGAITDIKASQEACEALQKNEYIRYQDLLRAKRGRLVDVEFVRNAYLVGGEKVNQRNIRDISERRQAQTLLREQSVRDHLTGLFNRRYKEI